MKKISIFFLIIAICFFKANFVTAQVNVNDSLALIDLYNSTDGAHWVNSKIWLTKSPVSTWFGIKTTGNRITSISLGLTGLTGYIPSSIGNLTNLTYLDLHFNTITGIIPSELGNLSKLTYLDLSKNNLSEGIPPELGNLTNLTNLNLGYNQNLGDSIPSSLGNLIHLVHLDLQFNKLRGSIPSSLGNLINLETLILNRNDLSGAIPPELGNLVNLRNLSLFDIYFNSTIPPELGNLTHLIYLDLSQADLIGNIPSELGKLKNLKILNLWINKLTGSIPSSLGNLFNLTDLNLSENNLSGSIPPALGKITNLAKLDLSQNQLSGSIPSSFSSFTNPDLILNLSYNKLSGYIIQFDSSLRKAAQIYIQGNKFTFAGIIFLKRNFFATYSPQAHIALNQNGNVLSVYTGGANQLTYDTFKWYKNGNLVSTITGDSVFTPTTNGNYSVAVTNSIATALTLYSDTVNFLAADNSIASKMNYNSSASLYPNPAKTNATLSFNADGKYTITVADVSGKVLQTKTGIAVKGTNIIQFDFSKYASGIYLITIADEKNKKQTIRMGKE